MPAVRPTIALVLGLLEDFRKRDASRRARRASDRNHRLASATWLRGIGTRPGARSRGRPAILATRGSAARAAADNSAWWLFMSPGRSCVASTAVNATGDTRECSSDARLGAP